MGTALGKRPLLRKLTDILDGAKGLASHHIIPKAMAYTDDTVRVFLNGGTLGGRKWPGIGFLTDDKSNGVLLAHSVEMLEKIGGTRHYTSHEMYDNAIRDTLIRISGDAEARLVAGDSMELVLEEAASKVSQLQKKAAEILNRGTLQIHPPKSQEIYDLWYAALSDI